MTTKTKPYNPFDHLITSDEAIAEYITEAYQDEDPEVFILALGYLAKKRSISAVAKKTGLNRENLYKVFNGKVKPQWSTVQKIMKALDVNITTSVAA